MDELHAVIDHVVAARDDAALATVPAAALGAEITELLRARARLDGEIQRRVAAFDARGLGDVDGAPSTAAWLRGHARLAPAEASTRVRTARLLRYLPGTSAALRSGAISLDHARAITALAGDTDPQVTAGAEDELVFVARAVNPLDLSRVLRQVRDAVAKDRGRRDEANAWARRRLSLASSFDGMMSINGWLTGESGALLRTALDTLARPVPGERRTLGQRYADALTELARRSLERGDLPTRHGTPPSLVVITAVEPAAAGQDSAALRFGPGTTIGGGSLTPEAVTRLSCDATVTRVLLDPAGEVLDLGRSSRVVSPAQWRALVVRDGGCVVPGHDCPPEFCQAHHLRPWVEGGTTDLDGLALVCTHAHRLVHEGGFALRLGADEHWVLRRPDGSDIVGARRGQTAHGGLAHAAAAILVGPRGP